MERLQRSILYVIDVSLTSKIRLSFFIVRLRDFRCDTYDMASFDGVADTWRKYTNSPRFEFSQNGESLQSRTVDTDTWRQALVAAE